jgi:Spy/CpxP family protein refolding chaperone
VWVLGCAIVLAAASGPAQEPAEPPEQPLPHDRPELGLSQEQKDQMRQIREEQRAKMEAVRNDESLTPEQRREKMRELRRETRSRVDGVLTEEQKAKLKEFRKEHRGREGRRGGMRRPRAARQAGPQ